MHLTEINAKCNVYIYINVIINFNLYRYWFFIVNIILFEIKIQVESIGLFK